MITGGLGYRSLRQMKRRSFYFLFASSSGPRDGEIVTLQVFRGSC